ncbi:MAG TPA: VTT domain-containing protein, partial [Tepidisphaeraceae bacterium]|nr:VTT domain-containing protein [Tepidisphaeraceae bacterium]
MIRLASLLGILVGLMLIVRTLPVAAGVQWLEGWLADLGVWGPVAFAAVYVLAAVLFVPGGALTLVAGGLFGLVVGLITVSIASTTAAAVAFLIGRYLARDMVREQTRRFPRFRAIDRAIGDGGWRIVLMLRLVPVFPFSVGNYLLGLTPVPFWHYVLASWVGMLPGTFIYIYLGHVGRKTVEAVAAGTDAGLDPLEWVLLIIGGVMAIAVVVYLTRLVRRKLNQETQPQSDSDEEKPVPADTSRSSVNTSRRPIALVIVAVVVLGLGACATLRPNWLSGLFGPPAVTMSESYERRPGGPRFDHASFDALLREHVNANGGVDYAALISSPDALRAYNRSLSEAPWEALGRDEKLALLINAYNSFTLELMVEWLPRDGINGIRDIPADRRWDDERWNIGGNVWSLNQIEHEQIRPHFREPRIHWAVVCAAVGCPPLRAEAYVAERLDEQLADQERIIHTDGARWLRFDTGGNVLHLTQLYNWYGGDFEQVAGSVLAYVSERVPAVARVREAGTRIRIAWLDYDWSLN